MTEIEYYLEIDDIIDAHRTGYKAFGDSLIGVDRACVERRVVEPQTKYWGVEQYPGLFKKAAVYLYKITISHCFSDGNKRAAFLSTDFFLNMNGYQLIVEADELFEYCLTIANNRTRPTLEEVEEWIREHAEPFDNPFA